MGRVRELRLVGAVALALAASAVVATVAGLQAVAGQEYWRAGYHRLMVDSVTERFDHALPIAAGAALVLAFGGHLVRRGRPHPPGRRSRAALVVIGVVLVLRGSAGLEAWWTSAGPNLVLISIDTLRADHLGAYGSPLPTSPTVDGRLAATGVTFEQAYSQAPKTTPSHMTMLTSLYPSAHGVEMWQGTGAEPVLSPAVHTLAEVLKNAGYATGAFTGGVNVDPARGFAQGFDVYRQGTQLRRAVRWLERHRGRKFFLFFHTYDVHDPYLPPPELVARFAPDYHGPLRDVVQRLRDSLTTVSGWQEAHNRFWAAVDRNDPEEARFVARLYDAAIRHMDEATLAPLLDAIDGAGLAGNTLVVFTSDHGEAFGEHGAFQHDDLYAGTLRVPLILRFPGRLAPGTRVAARARVVDLMPTVLDLLGVEPPPAMQGESLVPLLSGPATAAPRPVISECNQRRLGRVFQSVRRDGYTYVVDGPTERLFADASEREDVASSRPDVVIELRAELARFRTACADLASRFPPRGVVAPDAGTIRGLRALGYVE